MYRKHTNFAIEPKRADFQGYVFCFMLCFLSLFASLVKIAHNLVQHCADFFLFFSVRTTGYGRRNTCLLPRQGDLISQMYLYVKMARVDSGNGGARMVEDVGRAMIDEAQFEVGSVIYDRLFPEQMHMHEELNVIKELHGNKLTGKSSSVAQLVQWAKSSQHLFIELPFYFSQDKGSAYPSLATHLTDTRVNIVTKPKSSLIVGNPAPYVIQAADAEWSETYLLMETVYLDDSERRWLVESEVRIVEHLDRRNLLTIN